MSKHLGNGVDPIDMIEKYGADALRLSLINGMSMGTDIKYGEEKAKESKIFINKLYNASKFVLQNIENIDIKDIIKLNLDEKDKWILNELDGLIKQVNKNIDKYALGVATSNLMEFTVAKFCDWYIELSKVDLYGDNQEKKTKTQNVLMYVLTNLLKLFHPFIPFVTEYIYQNIPNHEETIMLCDYPNKVAVKDLKNNFIEIIEIIKSIRNVRAEFNVPDNKRTSIYLLPLGQTLAKDNLQEIAKLGYGIDCQIIDKEPDEKCTKIICSNVNIFIPMGQLVDTNKERERIEKEIASVKFEIERSKKMLSNAGFIAKAPQKLVEQEKEKLQANEKLLAKLSEQL
jgi:valyl-tRNA synthetase